MRWNPPADRSRLRISKRAVAAVVAVAAAVVAAAVVALDSRDPEAAGA